MNTRFAAAVAVCGGVAAITTAMLIGPVFSPEGFSWVTHSTSEQAGQHMPRAWIMRAGFIFYGAGTIAAALLDLKKRPYVRASLVLFGLGLTATAIWSNAPIVPGLPTDLNEDWLHSIASGVVGFAFAAACGSRLFAPGGNGRDGVSWIGLALAILIPLAMNALPEARGLLQRIMFAYSFVFVLREFLPGRSGRDGGGGGH